MKPNGRDEADLYASYREPAEDREDAMSPRPEATWFVQTYLLAELATLANTRVLELGAGLGDIATEIRRRGWGDLRAVDSSPAQVERARRRGNGVELSDGLEALRSERESSLGAVVILDVLEHLSVDACCEWLEAVRSRLMPGGKVLVRVPNGAALFAGEIRWGDLTHQRAFTEESVRQLFRLAGLRFVCARPLRPPPGGFVRTLRRVTWAGVEAVLRLCHVAETGRRDGIFTRNIVATGEKPATSEASRSR